MLLTHLHSVTIIHTFNYFWTLWSSGLSSHFCSVTSILNSELLASIPPSTLRLNSLIWSSMISCWSKSKSHCDRRSVSRSVSLGVEPHLGLMTRYLLLFENYAIVFCGAPSLTRGRVCLLYMLLDLSSAAFLGSESLETRDRILLSQIWDFPFSRFLRLAGSRWRYSTPPPHGDLSPAEQRQSHIATDSQSVSQSVLVSSPICGPWPDIYYCLRGTVLLLWEALSDERTGLSFVRVASLSSCWSLLLIWSGLVSYLLQSDGLEDTYLKGFVSRVS
jgi:hypothetical protein